MLRHFVGKACRGLALVELAGALGRDARERVRELRLDEPIAGLVQRAVVQKDPLGLGRVGQALGRLEQLGETPGQRKTLHRQLHRWRHVFGPLFPPVLVDRDLEAAHRARHARRPPPLDAVLRQLTLGIQIHVARRLLRRPLAKIDEGGAAVGHPNQHVTAAADVAGVRMRDGHREADGDGRIHGVAAVLQYGDANVGGGGFHRHHHAVSRAKRLPGSQWN